MHFSEETVDDLMNVVLKELIHLPFDVKATRGASSELVGVLLHLKNPRARLSRTEIKGTPFSALGELIWYLAGSNELSFIYYYIKKYEKETEDGKTIYGGYGPRLLNSHGQYNQIENVVKLLRAKPSSRKAVIQLFDAKDIAAEHKEIPCTCTMQFLVRANKLHMVTYMRSNDAFVGLPHDIFTFTMLQEIMARDLSVEIGEYTHSVGSLHLYEKDVQRATQYLAEGFQGTLLNMPTMPLGSPWESINNVIQAERTIRGGYKPAPESLLGEAYWADMVRLLQVFSLIKTKDADISKLEKLMNEMSKESEKVYNIYIKKRIEAITKNENA